MCHVVLLAIGLIVLPACTPASSASLGSIRGTVTAGPVCPVVTDPPDPACADRAVAGAEIVVQGADGLEVARVRSGTDGRFSLQVQAGTYRVVPQPVTGLLGTASPQEVAVTPAATTEVAISYDTGIR
ncbi:MAG TPA: carboxypeptidase-like regulatory domain-containing protein [Candidatus Limnocylindria bacterium]